jgi:hypothetical protein
MPLVPGEPTTLPFDCSFPLCDVELFGVLLHHDALSRWLIFFFGLLDTRDRLIPTDIFAIFAIGSAAHQSQRRLDLRERSWVARRGRRGTIYGPVRSTMESHPRTSGAAVDLTVVDVALHGTPSS